MSRCRAFPLSKRVKKFEPVGQVSGAREIYR